MKKILFASALCMLTGFAMFAEENIEYKVIGSMSGNLDLNMGYYEPDLVEPPVEVELKGFYKDGKLTITPMLNVNDHPVTFTIDIATGLAVAENTFIKSEDFMGNGSPIDYYYGDLATQKPILYGAIRNTGDNTSELYIQPWGLMGDYSSLGIGIFFEAVYYNTIAKLNFAIEGLGEHPEASPGPSETPKNGDKFSYVYEGRIINYSIISVAEKTVKVDKNISVPGELILPEKVYYGDAYTLVEIGEKAFEKNINLTDITIPNSVEKISNEAFYGCSGLTSAEIGNSVTQIKGAAFMNCYALSDIVIPNSVIEIGQQAFWRCNALTSIIIPDSVTELGSSAFEECSGLTTAILGNSLISISNDLFFNCSNLKNVVIGNSVTEIGNSAFYQCTSLTDIEIPESVNTIKASAFSFCSGLTSIEIPNSVITVGRNAFSNCSGLTNAVIGDAVQEISGQMFYNCTNLKDVVLGKSVKKIGENAFQECTNLSNISLPASVTSIGNEAFRACIALTEIMLPNSVQQIGDNAFYSCNSLANVKCEAINPPVCGNNVFSPVTYETAELHVPKGSKDAYAAAEAWKNFNTMVDDLPGTVGVADGLIDFNNNSNVYNMQGILVKRNATAGDIKALNPGLYIIGGKKVLVK